MSKPEKISFIVIGGSAGSLPVLMQIIKLLTGSFVPILIVIHRQKNVSSELTKIFSEVNRNIEIVEPEDKEPIRPSAVYVAPQNYHLLIEKDKTFSLDYSEPVRFSRPSIDVTFESASLVFKNTLAAVLLSGANNDGTDGLAQVVEQGGVAIAQEPSTADYPAMPLHAINAIHHIRVLDPLKICKFINGLYHNQNIA